METSAESTEEGQAMVEQTGTDEGNPTEDGDARATLGSHAD